MEDRTITIQTEDGKEILCDILFTYHSTDFNKDYVVFTSREDGITSAAAYTATGDSTGSLEQIKTEEEWSMLEDVLNDYNNQNEGCQGGCSSCSSCDSCGGSCQDCDCSNSEEE